MDSLTLTHEYTRLMTKAELAPSRQEALHLIKKATVVKEALAFARAMEKR